MYFFTVITLCHEGSVANPIKFFLLQLEYNVAHVHFDKLFKVLPTNLVNFYPRKVLETQLNQMKKIRSVIFIKKYDP